MIVVKAKLITKRDSGVEIGDAEGICGPLEFERHQIAVESFEKQVDDLLLSMLRDHACLPAGRDVARKMLAGEIPRVKQLEMFVRKDAS